MTDLLAYRDKKPRRHDEEDMQKAIVQHLKLRGTKNTYWFGLINDTPSSPRTQARMKAKGLRPGMFDMGFILAGGESAWLELKTTKGKLSADQKAFEAWCILNEIPYHIAYSLDSALTWLEEVGVLKPQKF